MKDDLEPEEYEETRTETLKELEAFNDSLQEMMDGNMDLVSELSKMQLSIRKKIKATSTGTKILSKLQKEAPATLRVKLANIRRDFKLKKISEEMYREKSVNILCGLKRLGAKLDSEEEALLDSDTQLRSLFQKASGASLGTAAAASVIATATTEIKRAGGSG